MSCLGGSWSDPRPWVRFSLDGDLPVTGRVEGCSVVGPRTDPRLCHGCPAFRGVDRDGLLQTGVAANGDLIALSQKEHERWQDDPEAFWRAREEGSVWGLRYSDTLEWQEHWAAYMRRYYHTMTPGQRARKRAATRAAVARLRARRKSDLNVRGTQNVESPG